MKGTDWNLADLIFRLTQTWFVTFWRPFFSRDQTFPPQRVPPTLPSVRMRVRVRVRFLMSTSENPVSMANHCSFHPIKLVFPVLLVVSNFKCITDNYIYTSNHVFPPQMASVACLSVVKGTETNWILNSCYIYRPSDHRELFTTRVRSRMQWL